jgi:hypothetical protein
MVLFTAQLPGRMSDYMWVLIVENRIHTNTESVQGDQTSVASCAWATQPQPGRLDTGGGSYMWVFI